MSDVELANGRKVEYPETSNPLELLRRFVESFANEPLYSGSAKARVYDQAKRAVRERSIVVNEESDGSSVLEVVDSLIQSPPGLDGIHTENLGHIGNKYVDAGWIAGLQELKARILG